jgi:hypothetical protein
MKHPAWLDEGFVDPNQYDRADEYLTNFRRSMAPFFDPFVIRSVLYSVNPELANSLTNHRRVDRVFQRYYGLMHVDRATARYEMEHRMYNVATEMISPLGVADPEARLETIRITPGRMKKFVTIFNEAP